MNENTNTQTQNEDVLAHTQVAQDLKNAVLIVSVVVNMAVFTTWLTLQFA
jgi:hypothetical protein